MVSKRLPENITFYCQSIPSKLINEVTEEDYGLVLPAFPKDAKGKNDTAISWAKGYYRKEPNHNIKSGLAYTGPNDDIYNVAIVDISYRGQGSKVYKALVHDKFLIDISVECLFEVLSCGHIENGRIKSPMIFGVARNKLSLILKNGKYHKDILFQEAKDISTKDLVKFNLYENLHSKHIFFGKFPYTSIDLEYKDERVGYCYTRKVACGIFKKVDNVFVNDIVSTKDIQKPTYKTNGHLSYNRLNHTKTFSVKLDNGPFNVEEHYSDYLKGLEEQSFVNFDVWNNSHHIEFAYNLIKALGYTPKSDELKRMIAFVDSLPSKTNPSTISKL